MTWLEECVGHQDFLRAWAVESHRRPESAQWLLDNESVPCTRMRPVESELGTFVAAPGVRIQLYNVGYGVEPTRLD